MGYDGYSGQEGKRQETEALNMTLENFIYYNILSDDNKQYVIKKMNVI